MNPEPPPALSITRSILYALQEAWYQPPQDNFNKFKTVDLVEDANHSRLQAIKYKAHLKDRRIKRRILGLYEAAQSWIVVLLVGVAIGSSAAFIDISVSWLSDLKVGVCKTSWYLNKKFCCWEEEGPEGACTDWATWGSLVNYTLEAPLNFVFYLSFSTLFAFLSAYLVKRFAPTAAGSGIPQIKTILGGFILPDFLGKSTLLIKTISLILAVSSGLSLGKEGPSVHLACCIGAVISKWFSKFKNNHGKNREILSAASAAGVAVAFGSPIGGVLYSLEELSTLFPKKTLWRSFFGALVATVVLHSWNPFRTGKIVLFQVESEHSWHAFEILIFIFIGLFGGLYGVLTTRLNLWITAFRQKHLKGLAIYEISLLATITSAICYFNIFLSVDMSEAMYILFKECDKNYSLGLCKATSTMAISSLLWAAFVRAVLVIMTYGCDVPTGIFIPSMAIGACFGRAVGIYVKSIYVNSPGYWFFKACPAAKPCIFPGTYAILGAAATLCGITRMTVSVVVIMFELTGATEFILPLMITVIVAKAVGDVFHHGGIADQAIKWKGFPFMENEASHFGALPVAQAMSKRPTCIPATGLKLNQLEKILRDNNFKGFPVIKRIRDHRLEGFISRESILKVLDEASKQGATSSTSHCFFGASDSGPVVSSTSIDFGSQLDQNPFIIHPKLALETVQSIFRNIGYIYLRLLTFQSSCPAR
ncbi:glycerol ethanol, ferric requiring protein, variant 4 [Entomophthora muscae]|uniref:Glycerol ethanol, ferric requiring protein, variant 4 n=1 Tax=Entomophthora muscae TaxID=34485 RepID=A0ACC2TUI4_9FUNG|nr:glycerol ethanol, ferric requiring protein, variant 4 [Entomophthora muscae]